MNELLRTTIVNRLAGSKVGSKVATLALIALSGVVSNVWADVSGNWDFAVTLGQLGSGNAAVTLSEGGDGSLTGNYSGQLGQTAVTGSSDGTEFEFSFNSDAIGGAIVYSGSRRDDGRLSGVVVIQGQEVGTFVATAKP
ncbi:MAG: hypothetical protein R3F41_12415 [Gammaproteobacteria bacterium]|nr:hypothetical protein [Pseudomonadales bacterium]MCP5348900.1 hypothetical protein [Pseudomonadales bacterium]